MKLDKDRLFAAATPALTLLAGSFITAILLLVLPVTLYFFYRKRDLSQARETALKLIDLNLSVLVLTFALGLVLGAIGLVANDAGISLPRLHEGAIVKLLGLLGGLYLLVSYSFSTVKALKGQLHTATLSMGMIEALRGKRAATQPTDSASST